MKPNSKTLPFLLLLDCSQRNFQQIKTSKTVQEITKDLRQKLQKLAFS
jgi:hypothetical protein